MGMFDYIKFESIIPGRPANSEFQTKSFDNCLEHYVVTHKGELYLEEWSYAYHEDESLFLGGSFQKVPGTYRRRYLTDYHGDVIFYDDILNDEFVARFTNGRLSRVTFKTRERLNGEILYERDASWEQNSCSGNQERSEGQTEG